MEKQVFNCGFLLYCELVILYSISDFQSAQGTNAFKYAVSSERYAAGIIFYVFNIFGLGLLVYFGIFLLIHGFADRLSGETIGYLYDYVGALALILVFRDYAEWARVLALGEVQVCCTVSVFVVSLRGKLPHFSDIQDRILC